MKGSKSKAPPPRAAQAYSYETWEEARRVASRIGEIPSPFTTCIRFLRRDLENQAESLGKESTYWLRQFLRSPTFKAPLYYGAQTFFPEQLELESDLFPSTFLRLYSLPGLINALCIIYLSKRTQTSCDATEYKKLAKILLMESEMAAAVGQAMPRIGFPLALVVGSMRQLGRALFLLVDKAGFIAHVRATRSKGAFDLQDEIQRWRCNHVQVASILLQILGVGVELGTSLVNGLSSQLAEMDSLDEDARKVLVCDLWVQALMKTGKEPEITHRGEFYPAKANLQKLLETAGDIRKNGSKDNWLLRGRDDVLPDQEPALTTAPEELAEDLEDIVDEEE